MLTLPIEIGKKYVTRDGQIVTTEKVVNDGSVCRICRVEDYYLWMDTGLTSLTDNQNAKDLVADYIEPLGHIHAEKMEQYAEDAKTNPEPWKLWEFYRPSLGEWNPAIGNPMWANDIKYRRKPRTINSIEVPEPLRVAPAGGTKVWIPSLSCKDKCHARTWRYDNNQWELELERGLVHTTREAAIAHAEALLSFTKA